MIQLNIKRFLAVLAISACMGMGSVHAQNWPEDVNTAKEKYALMIDSYNGKKYEEVVDPFEWIIQRSPNFDENIYKVGIRTYEEMQAKEQDATKKITYQNRVLELYDQRIKHKFYSSEADIMARKADNVYPYLIDRKETKVAELYDFYLKVVELNGKDARRQHLIYLMDLACRQKVAGAVNDEQLADLYDTKLNPLVEAGLAGADKAKWEKTKEQIDAMYTQYVKIDCDFVKKNWGPKLEANPTDVALAKKIVSRMASGNCVTEPLFLKAATAMYDAEKDPNVGKTIAKLHLANGNNEKALDWYEKVVEQLTDPKEKGEILMNMARMYTRSSKSKAREFANKAADADKAQAGDAYILIGDLYMSSYNDCKGGRDVVEEKACFFAAYDMYSRAGSNSKMANAQQYFPTREEMFIIGKKPGDSIGVGCWIGGSTTIRSR